MSYPLYSTEVGEHKDLEPEMVKKPLEQVELLRDRLKEAHDRQKSYADKHWKDLEFAVGDAVYLKIRTFRGADKNWKLKKLKQRYITKRIGVVAYRLVLPLELSIFHDVFYVSNLQKVTENRNWLYETRQQI